MSGFWKYAEQDPASVAVVDPDGTEHSAGELLDRCNRVVHALRGLGMGHGDSVAVLLPNGVRPVEVYLAALQAGWYYVPVNYRLSAPEIAYIITDSGAKAFIAHERFADVARAAADEAGVPADARGWRWEPSTASQTSTRCCRPCRAPLPTTAPRAPPCTTRRERRAGPRV